MTQEKFKKLDGHTIAVCKYYLMDAMDCSADMTRKEICKVLGDLNHRVHEAKHGKPKGAYDEKLA